MDAIIKYKVQRKFFLIVVLCSGLLFSNKALAKNNSYTQSNSKLPSYLIGTYTGTLLKNSSIYTNGKCTIRKNSSYKYTLVFSNGVSSISNISFSRDDDTYTSFFVYKGTKLAISLDEDGDLSINSVNGNSRQLSFNGELSGGRTSSKTRGRTSGQNIGVSGNDVLIRNGNQTIRTGGNDDVVINNNGSQRIDVKGNDDVVIRNNGNQSIDVSGNDVFIKNGNQTIDTNGNGVSIRNGGQVINTSKKRRRKSRKGNGNISISSGGNDININGQISIGNQNSGIGTEVCYGETNCNILNCEHTTSSRNFYECGSHEISQLPLDAIGFYKGDLVGYNADTSKGICKIVETGCKTYRLDFSNNLPSIHGVQFGRKNNFNEYTSVIISGQYSAAIEIDMTFSDLAIDGEIMTIDFDGEKQ